MMGTSFSQIPETFCKPPKITNNAVPQTNAETIAGSHPKLARTTLVIALV